jgi:gas vesicle protein
MSEDGRERSRALMTGLIIGGLAGVLLGVLIAPQEGERTRKALKERVGELATAGAAIGGLIADVAGDTASSVAEQVAGAADRVRDLMADEGGVRRVVSIGKEAAAREFERLSGTYRAISARDRRAEAEQAAAEGGGLGPAPGTEPV